MNESQKRLDKELSIDKIIKKLRKLDVIIQDLCERDEKLRTRLKLDERHIIDLDPDSRKDNISEKSSPMKVESV
jgi:hypothetical protein